MPVGEVGGGVGNAIVGTLFMVGLASCMGLPLGVGAGIFLAERGDGRLGNAVRFTAEVLAGVPSIVIGVVAYGLIVMPMHHFSALAGAVALAILMIPTLARATEEMIRLVPPSLREASLALGVPAWRTSLSVVLRTALGGLVNAALLAIARAAGETAPLLFTALNNQYWNVDPSAADGVADGADLQLRHQPVRRLARQGLGRGAVSAADHRHAQPDRQAVDAATSERVRGRTDQP